MPYLDGGYGSSRYTRDGTGLLLVDPYNDFLSEGANSGRGWKASPRMSLLTICGLFLPRSAKPASRFFSYLIVDGNLATTWAGIHPTPYQIASGKAQAFAKGSWGGEWHPDFARKRAT